MPGGPLLGAGTAAAAGGGFPWSILLALLPSLLGDMFGDSEEEQMADRARQAQQMMRTLGMKQPYQSPFTGQADSALIQLIMGRLGKMGNWGYPEGQGMDMSFLEDIAGSLPGPGPSRRIQR